MAALLRLQQQREGRIAANVDPFDRVHLDGYIEFHGMFRCGLLLLFYMLASNAADKCRGSERGAISRYERRSQRGRIAPQSCRLPIIPIKQTSDTAENKKRGGGFVASD